MASTVPVISQKEYLKKYLSNNKKKKKKPKICSSSFLKRSRIIDDDDDLGLNNMASVEDEEFNLDYLGDEAPQIAGVVDERPAEVRAQDYYSNSQLWKNISENGDNSTDQVISPNKQVQDKLLSLESKLIKEGHKKSRREERVSKEKWDMKPKVQKQPPRSDSLDSDLSPPRNSKGKKSEKRRKASEDSDSDMSLPRAKQEGVRKRYKEYNSKNHKERDDYRKSRSNLKNEKKRNESEDLNLQTRRKKKGKQSDSDVSPPRKSGFREKHEEKKSREYDSDLSPPRKTERRRSTSPLRRTNSYGDQYDKKGRRGDESKNIHSKKVRSDDKCEGRRKRDSDSDPSPPRKLKGEKRERGDSSDLMSSQNVGRSRDMRERRDFAHIIPKKSSKGNKKQDRRNKREYDSDLSPPRKSVKGSEKQSIKEDSDSTPPRQMSDQGQKQSRRKDDGASLTASGKKSKGKFEKRKDSDSYLSPPRKTQSEGNREKLKKKVAELSERCSPPKQRKKKVDSDSDLSPQRNKTRLPSSRDNLMKKDSKAGKFDEVPRSLNSSKEYSSSDSDLSPPRKSRKDALVCSPLRDSKEQFASKKKTSNTKKLYDKLDKKSDKMEKTLDGKKAGLQSAKLLKEELESLKKKEEAMLKEMNSALSGEGAAPIMRDRKTGKQRDLKKEEEEKRLKSEKNAVHKEKYAKWGKGLKQVEDTEKRVAEVLHEMSKPLARYADDTDLDNYLKAQEREGDPMLDYIRQKQSEAIETSEPSKPKYKGSFMPNRFGIAPGYRWDGVDRSNGYEKEWFEQRNAKKALQEEAYKWSTSDM